MKADDLPFARALDPCARHAYAARDHRVTELDIDVPVRKHDRKRILENDFRRNEIDGSHIELVAESRDEFCFRVLGTQDPDADALRIMHLFHQPEVMIAKRIDSFSLERLDVATDL